MEATTTGHEAPAFPVTWERAGDERFFWEPELMHFPDIQAPLTSDVTRLLIGGFIPAAKENGIPAEMYITFQHGRAYQAIVPLVQGEPSLEEAQAIQQHMMHLVGGLAPRWHNELLPEIQQLLDRWAAFDLAAATDQQVFEHFDVSWAMATRAAHIHFLIALPMLLSMGVYDDVYNDLFGHQGLLTSAKLMQGLHNKSTESDQALWDLSRKARALPAVRTVLEERAAVDVLSALHESTEGRSFLAELHAFLQEYGQRSNRWDIIDASWIEDPTPVIKTLKDDVGQEAGSPRERQDALAQEREKAIATARQALANYPQEARNQFEFMLAAGQAATQLQEDHGFWIDQRCFYRLRQVIMEVGTRFVHAGVLTSPDDIFYLYEAEVRSIAAATVKPDKRPTVAARKADLQRQRETAFPPFIGTLPPGPPPDNPMLRSAGKFFGGPPPAAEHANELRGFAGSAGTLTARVRVAHSLNDADALQRGEVLVTETTAPPWTHLFSIAGAVVTDTGGPLSHCAIVAREYMIPAVVGTGAATARLRTGMLVEVDGTKGVVRILGEG